MVQQPQNAVFLPWEAGRSQSPMRVRVGYSRSPADILYIQRPLFP